VRTTGLTASHPGEKNLINPLTLLARDLRRPGAYVSRMQAKCFSGCCPMLGLETELLIWCLRIEISATNYRKIARGQHRSRASSTRAVMSARGCAQGRV
jgi:hypothetical protein